MGQDLQGSSLFDLNSSKNDLHMQQWFQFVQQSQLLLALRKQRRKVEKYKTMPCQAWKDAGRCNYGKRCKFAHGPAELRPGLNVKVKVLNNPRYRTKPCIKYATFGYCPYGDRCYFIHEPVKVDLEKCLDQLSASRLSLSQLSREQTHYYLGNTSFSRTELTNTRLEDWRKSSCIKVTSESERSTTKPESCNVPASLQNLEPILETIADAIINLYMINHST